MANITDYTYYQQAKRLIPNANNLNTEIQGVPNVTSSIDEFIVKYERELLIGFLGITLYNELKSALDDLPNADIKWQNLVEGVEYVKDSVTYRFDGLRGFEKDSLVAFYVFCKYMENDESYYSTTGVTKSNAQNANNFTPTRKYLDAWYMFLDKYQDNQVHNEQRYLYDSWGCVVGVDYYNNGNSNKIVSLETYLKDHSSDFDGYDLHRYTSANSLGL